MTPGGEGKPAILPLRNAPALSGAPPTCNIGTSLTGSSPNPLIKTRAATADALPTRLIPMLLPLRSSAVLIDTGTTNSYGSVLRKQATITRLAPPTLALATPPPDAFPTETSPAMMLATAVVVLGM